MDAEYKLSRRKFLISSGVSVLGIKSGLVNASLDLSDVDRFITYLMKSRRIPGVTAAIVKDDKLVWSKGYGWADIERQIAMDPENTLLGIASVSKTITTTAIMQLWEQDRFRLDNDINSYLPFAVRNPFFPDVPITFRHLLTHRSSIKDGPALWASYKCGDPKESLQNWLREYFSPNGSYYNKEENFHRWTPGEQQSVPGRTYSNVGFGLLGLLVESISGIGFGEYCQDKIFKPLGMKRSSWYINEIEPSKHAIPYSYVSEVKLDDFLLRLSNESPGLYRDDYLPHCFYSYATISDGSLITSAHELSRFLMAYINHGTLGNSQILQEHTVRTILSRQVESRLYQGLGWRSMALGFGGLAWGHYGRDPGMRAAMFFKPSSRTGVIVIMNSISNGLDSIVYRLFHESDKL